MSMRLLHEQSEMVQEVECKLYFKKGKIHGAELVGGEVLPLS